MTLPVYASPTNHRNQATCKQSSGPVYTTIARGKVQARPATQEDCGALAPNIKPIDVVECHAAGLSPLDALVSGMQAGPSWALEKEGTTHAMFGVVPGGEAGVGIPWLLTDSSTRSWARFLVWATPQFLDAWNLTYDTLENHCHIDNALTIAWLKHVGFVFDGAEIHTQEGIFLHFERKHLCAHPQL